MKKLLLLLLTAFMTLSCSSDDNSSGSDTVKLKRTITRTEIAEYSYGSNGYLSEIKYTDSSDKVLKIDFYEYNGNEVKEWRYKTDDRRLSKAEYFYQNGLIATAMIYENVKYKKNYEYDSSQNLSQETYFSGEENRLEHTTDFVCDSNGNITKSVIKYPGNEVKAIRNYQYDNKNNPFKNVFPESYLKVMQIGKNNIIDETIKYEYNEKGYPIIMYKTHDDYIETTKFEYY